MAENYAKMSNFEKERYHEGMIELWCIIFLLAWAFVLIFNADQDVLTDILVVSVPFFLARHHWMRYRELRNLEKPDNYFRKSWQ